MAGPLDDLNFKIEADLGDGLESLREMARAIDNTEQKLRDLAPAYRELNAANEQLSRTLQSIGASDAADNVQYGLNSMLRTVERLEDQTRRWADRIDGELQNSSVDVGEKWLYVQTQVRSGEDALRRFTQQAKQAAAATQTIVVDTVSQRVQMPQQRQAAPMDLIKLASAAIAMKAVSGVSTALTTARNVVVDIGTSTRQTVSEMTRFRIGLAAAKVDPALNTLPGLIDRVSKSVAGSVDRFRGFTDATVNGIPQILQSIAGGMGQVLGSGDSLQATISKLVADFSRKREALNAVVEMYPSAGTAVELFSKIMDKVAPVAENIAQKVDSANASVRDAAISTRNLAYLATGAFAKTGTSADLYARGAWHALLPTRLLYREHQGFERILKVSQHAWAMLTHPIHVVSMAFSKGNREFKEMRATLPPLNADLGNVVKAFKAGQIKTFGDAVKSVSKELAIGTRTIRAFSHATFFFGTYMQKYKPLVPVLTWTASKLWGLVRPAKAAQVGLDGVATGGQKAGIILRGVTSTASLAANGLNKVAASGGKVASSTASAGFGTIGRGANMAKTAAAGLAAGMIALGTSTAIATEKNTAVFGTMLKDMGQGAAVVKSLQGTQAAKLFDNQELLDSGRLLFKANVSAKDLAGKTNQLATIAAATSTELGDLARIYQQGASTGSFGQDKINQLAERGIDIYHALEAATGANGAELKKMISDGKIGITEMDAALAHLTEGNGIYAGSLETMANTTAGKMATIKNNVSQALGEVMGVAIEVLQPFGTAIVTLSESLSAAFTAFREPIIYAATAVAWLFGNMFTLAEFAFASMALFAVTGFNDIAYWFTDKLPAYLTWFSQNWKQVFWDAGNLIVTVFANIGKNIGSAMKSIWNYIKSGGTAELSFAFVPLLDGFKATVSGLPEIPDRAMTELEKSLTAQTEGLGGQLADNFDMMLADAQTKVDKGAPEIKDTGGKLEGGDGADSANKAANKAAENKAIGVQSAEGQSLAAQIQRGMLTKEDKALKVAEDQKVILERMERNQRKQGAQQGKPF